MKQPQRRPSIFFNLILFMGLVIVWIAFAPVKMGGQASYVMVSGISMEPGYHTGDLVLVRKAQTYQVGDVVTYRDTEMGSYVIHRIIGIEQGLFVLKGDNNSWIDPAHPTYDQVIGKQWIHVPKLGRAVQWLRMPINFLLTIAVLGGVFMTSMITKSPAGGKGKKRPSAHLGGLLEGTLYLLGFLFLGFLGMVIFAFTRSSTRIADTIPYQQGSSYFYSATGTPGVYDTEMVRTGEPVFPRLACFLNIGHTYTIQGNQFQDISGSQQMFARIMDEPSGWQRTIPLLPQTAFTGNSYFTVAALDLCQLETLVNLVEKETGLHTSTYTVEIVTNIAFTANASGQVIADTFDPILAFKYDKVHLYLANAGGETDLMHSTKEGLAGSSNVEVNTLRLFGWEPTIYFIRVSSLIGFLISLSWLVIMGLFVFKTARQSEEALIRLRYGGMLVEVYEKSLELTSTTIDVISIEDLAKLAERLGSMILHMTKGLSEHYLIQNNGTTYRYVIGMDKDMVTPLMPVENKKVEVQKGYKANPMPTPNQNKTAKHPAVSHTPMAFVEKPFVEPVINISEERAESKSYSEPNLVVIEKKSIWDELQDKIEAPVSRKSVPNNSVFETLQKKRNEYVIQSGAIEFFNAETAEAVMLSRIKI